MSKKLRAFCNILDYLDEAEPDVAQLFRLTCMSGALSNLKGKPGLTLLLPADADTRKKIAKLANSDNPTEAMTANNILSAHVLKDVFKSPSDFANKRDDIPNLLNQHVEVDAINGDEVKFKSGAVAKLDKRFIDSSRGSRLAVWSLKGEIEVTSDKPAKLKYMKRAKGKEGGDSSNPASNKLRRAIISAIENAYYLDSVNANTRMDKVGGDDSLDNELLEMGIAPMYVYDVLKTKPISAIRDSFLEYTLSLVNFIVNVRRDKKLFFEVVAPVLSLQKADIYNLLEPYKNDDHLIPDALVEDWWKSRPVFDFLQVANQIPDLLNEGAKYSNCALYKSRMEILAEIDRVRVNITERVQSNPRAIVGMVAEIYRDLAENNRIGSISGVFPDTLAEHYKRNPMLKMLQDEMRYCGYLGFSALENEPFDASKYNELLNAFEAYAGSVNTFEDSTSGVRLLNANVIRYSIAPVERYTEVNIFLHSTHFVYVPLTVDEMMKFPYKNVITKPNPDKLRIFNIEKAGYLARTKLFNTVSALSSNPDLVDNIRTLLGVNPANVDPALKDLIAKLNEKMNV
ncbi:hypothetical protein F-liban_306 [Faustovirus]|nr:hypothetical protein F-liban_306 [Faustovirus]SME64993.1 62 kDa polyprotein [Faustovirus ST1]